MFGRVVKDLSESAVNIREAITGDGMDLQKDKVILEAMKLQTRVDALQIELNKQENAKGGVAALWRPGIGVVCVLALAWQFLISLWLGMLVGIENVPRLDDSQDLMTLTMALLGMGGLRTFEKVRGVAKK